MVSKHRQPLPRPPQALQNLLRLPSQLAAGQFPVQSRLHLLDLAARLRLQRRQSRGLLLEPSLAPLAIAGKQPLGNQLGRLGRAPQTPAWGTIATGAITVTHVSAAHQVHRPFDLLTGLRQARGGPKLAADRAGAPRLSQGVMGGWFGQRQTPVPFGAWAARLLPPAPFGLTRSPSRSQLRARNWTLARAGCRAPFRRSRQCARQAVLGRFGFAPERLLLQPSQLPFKGSDLLPRPAHPYHPLREDLFGGQRSLFPWLLAQDRAGMLGPIIMSRLPITPWLQGELSGARRG